MCRLTTELETNGKILYLLESSIRPNKFFFTKDADVTGKCIFQVDYLYDVWVSEWSAICIANLSWYARFQWQASHDKKAWVDIGKEMATEKSTITSNMSADNDVEWIFANPIQAKETEYKYWRVLGTRGNRVEGWISLLLMDIQQ